MRYLPEFFLVAIIEEVLAHVHQLSEEQVSHLEEASAGGLHQCLQD